MLKRLDLYDEVIWDQHINILEKFENPDVLLHAPKGYWVAFEYERWRMECPVVCKRAISQRSLRVRCV